MTSSLAQTILARAAAQPDAIAVDDGATAITFGTLVARAGALAAQLAPCAAPIGILLPLSSDYIVAIVAMLIAGKTYVPMDDGFPEKRNQRIASHSGMTAVVVNEKTAPAMQALDAQLARIVMPGAEARAPAVAAPTDEDHVLTIFYTSGSTGEPKGVCHSEQGLLYDIRYFVEEFGLMPGDCHSLLFSPSVSISNRDIFGALAAGAKLAIVDLKRIGLAAATQAMLTMGVTVLHTVPSAFRALFAAGETRAAALAQAIRLVRLNGDRVTLRDVEIYRAAFARTSRLALDIATTETRPYAAWLVDHDTPLKRPLVPVGYLRPDLHVALIGEDGSTVPDGNIGEIVVASRGLSAGYRRDDALTAAKFKPSLRNPGMTEYHTGDYGRLLPDGLLEFVGRQDRQVKVRGNTVNLGEIEAVIGAYPSIGEAAVIARNAGIETRPIAYCIYAGPDAEEAIRDWCRAHLPAALCPAEIIRVEALPKLPTEKVDLIELQRLDAERVRAHAGIVEAPDAKEDVVSWAWRERLGRDAVARDVAFEDAGGDSLQGMLLLLAIERKLRRALPNGILDGRTRPSDLRARIAALDTAVRGSAARPTLFLFPGVFGADFASVRLARLIGAHFNVVLLDYRSASADFIGPVDPESVFRDFDAAFAAEGEPSRVWLLGYSFAGRIAAEAARRLIERGKPVEFAGVIDGPSEPMIAARNSQRLMEGAIRPPLAERITDAGGRVGYATAVAARALTNRFVNRHAYRAIGRTIEVLSALRLRAAVREARRTVLSRTRVRAFKAVMAGPLAMPLTLFVSTAPYSLSRQYPDMGWGPLCTKLDIIELAGNHFDILSEERAPALVGILADIEQRLRPERAA
jgi:amino acid adenylation domain-containing protein